MYCTIRLRDKTRLANNAQILMFSSMQIANKIDADERATCVCARECVIIYMVIRLDSESGGFIPFSVRSFVHS